MSVSQASSEAVAVAISPSLNHLPAPDADRPSGLFRSSSSTAAMGLYVPATLFIRLINFARIVILTWYMTTQQFGLLSMLLLVVNVLTPLLSVGLNEAAARYVPQFEARGCLREFLRRTLFLLTIVTGAGCAALLAVAPRLGMRFFGQFFYDEVIRKLVAWQLGTLTRICALVIVLLTFYFFVLAVLKGLRMIRALALIEFVHSLAFTGLAVAAAAMDRCSAKTMLFCYGASLVVGLAGCGLALWVSLSRWQGQARPVDEPRLYARLLAFSYWAMISGFTWQLLQYYPAWYLNKVMGNDAVAVFSAMRQIGQFILLGAITVLTVVMAAVTKTWETRGVEAADRQLSLAFRGAGVAMLLACGVIALGRGVLIRLFRVEYAVGAEILPLQLLFFLFSGHFAFIALHFNLIEKPRLHFLPYAVGVAANILLAYWLVGRPLARLESSATWQALSSVLAPIVSVGFSGPLALEGASWAGVLGIVAALASCLLLLRAEGRRLDRGSYVVIAASLVLATKDVLLVTGLLAFLWVALGTEWIFTAKERAQLFEYARASARSLFPASANASHGPD